MRGGFGDRLELGAGDCELGFGGGALGVGLRVLHVLAPVLDFLLDGGAIQVVQVRRLLCQDRAAGFDGALRKRR